MRNYRLLFLILFFLFCITLVPANAGASSNPIKLKAAIIHASTQPYALALNKWSELVEARTNGQVTISVFPGGSIVKDQQDSYAKVKSGATDITIGVVVKDDVPELQIIAFPAAFQCYEEWRQFMDGDIVEKYKEEFLQKTGIRILGSLYLGTRHVTSNKIYLKPADLKSVKLRAVQISIYMDTVKGLGAIPTPIAFPELLQALKTGIVDGQENPIPTIYQQKYYEAQKYVIETGHQRVGDFLMINEAKLKSLPPDIQSILLDTAREAELWESNLILEQEKDLRKELEAKGMVFITAEDGLDVEAFMESVQSYVWPKYEQEMGEVLKAVTKLDLCK